METAGTPGKKNTLPSVAWETARRFNLCKQGNLSLVLKKNNHHIKMRLLRYRASLRRARSEIGLPSRGALEISGDGAFRVLDKMYNEVGVSASNPL